MLSVKNLTKTYPLAKKKSKQRVVALDKVSIDFPETGLVFLLGKSGSGKSTLLNSIGGLDTFDSGEIIVKGKSSKDFSQSDFDSYRNTYIGFIFQEYNILENFTVAKNLAIAIELQGKKPNKEDVDKLLSQVEMLGYAKRKPNQLSGGQKQRVAIARALIKNPEIIMADEPTGALDSNTGKQVMDTLKNLSKTKLVIIVSHDREFAEIYGDRIIELKDGKVISDTTKKEVKAERTKSGVSVVDGRYIHIKKGQKISNDDVRVIVDNINNNTNCDTIISLNEKTNKKVKDAEFITDDGNNTAFLNTEKEDIRLKAYNAKDLKLIKSKLKFRDSFKMGTSALKTKVGKLIFMILLSLFAFTMFGIVDTFSCFNRGTAVYEGIQNSQTKFIIMQKEKKTDWGSESKTLLASDITMLQEKFKDYEFIPLVTVSNYLESNNVTVSKANGNYLDLTSSRNPAKAVVISKAIQINDANTLTEWGLSWEGHLPTSRDEVAITKHLWNNIKSAGKDISDNFSDYYIDLNVNGGNSKMKICGLVDTKDNFSKYDDLTDAELSDYQSKAEIESEIVSTLATFAFVDQTNFNFLNKNSSSNSYYYLKTTDGVKIDASFPTKYNTLEAAYTEYKAAAAGYGYETTRADFLSNRGISLDFYNGSTDSFVELGEKEIIVNEYLLSNITDKETAIKSGLYISVYDDYERKNLINTYKVVGTATYDDCCYASDETIEKDIEPYFSGFGGMLTTLKGTGADKDLVMYCENFNKDGIRFTIQNGTTSTLNMFEGMITALAQAFTYVGIVFAVFAALMLMNFIGTSIAHKKREIGVLRALGARGSDVFGIFFNESAVIATINFVLATIATFVTCILINNAVVSQIGKNLILLSPGIRQVLIILGVSFGSAFVASLLPVIKISRKKPIDAINNR